MRCAECKKRLGLVEETVGACKCGKSLCTSHRLPEQHGCTYEYKAEYQKKLQVQPAVTATKISPV